MKKVIFVVYYIKIYIFWVIVMKDDTKNLLRLLRYYKKYMLLCIIVIVLSLSYAGISLLSPIFEGKLLSCFENFNKGKIIEIACIVLFLNIVIQIVINLWSRAVLKLNGKVNFDLKTDMLDSLIKFEMKSFDNTNSGLFISRLNKDTTELSEIFDYITDDLSGIILNISFIVYVFFLNVYLGLFLVLNIILTYLLVSRKLFYYKKTKKIYKENEENLVGSYTDLVRGIREVKSLNLKDIFIEKICNQQKNTIKSEIKNIHIRRTWNRWIKSFQYILDFIFILISIEFISMNKLTVSTFLIIFLYKNKVLSLIDYIAEIREKLADGKIAATRVFDIIDFNSFSKEEFGKTEMKRLNGSVVFKDVSFSYNKKTLFSNFNFEIEPNQMIAIVGKSGEGKSTILKLINKSYSVNDGQILIDGKNINDLSERTIKNNISIVSQTPYIFNLSIKENIRLSKKDATDEDIIKVCKQAQIHDDIIKMENGYDTIVGENGTILSGGQKQRIAIARALIKKSKIILFDEATSSLDNRNQENIKNIMKKLSKNHTIIIVAHRLSTIINADKIYLLENHKIISFGTHDFLMNNCKKYKMLYKIEDRK